ncbi:hypothetical protein GCM10023194_67820 [Planotetraspora phitsanulokensis]|uniref:Uncharacterized protein n=1 Tax=Planotetraspora phitsanulokensis TaxID=575192 RepID=A0A8J3U7G2_9ACTN|nr:hypothetical protein Pph01_46580 [Planotetraspora phitsanulokensis]
MTSIPEDARMLDTALGTGKTVALPRGRLAYTERGSSVMDANDHRWA